MIVALNPSLAVLLVIRQPRVLVPSIVILNVLLLDVPVFDAAPENLQMILFAPVVMD